MDKCETNNSLADRILSYRRSFETTPYTSSYSYMLELRCGDISRRKQLCGTLSVHPKLRPKVVGTKVSVIVDDLKDEELESVTRLVMRVLATFDIKSYKESVTVVNHKLSN